MAALASPCVGDMGVCMKGQLKMSAYMNYGLLTVHIVQGRHLTSTWKLQPDTFVMISLIPDEANTTPTRCRTAIITDTSRPMYNEKFSFEVSDDDINKRLLMTIWHRDHNSGLHESLGCTSFGLRRMKTGEKEVKGWYHLLTDDVGRKKHLLMSRKERRPVPTMPSTSARRISSVNQDVPGLDRHDITMYRSQYGGFGFTVVDSCPVQVGRVDGATGAEEAGLQKGDIVIRVNGQNVSRSTSVSVARCIKRSGSVVTLEIHRPRRCMAPPTQQTVGATHTKGNNSDSDDSGSHSVQEFTICDDRAALIESAISVDTRRQAALHRLLCIEENFVEAMNSGIHSFSRPLRHCILTSTQHATLFQNIEKIACMSQYQVHQIVDNLPSYIPSDDDTDTLLVDDTNLTSAVGMIYLSKLFVLCQAYTMYIAGLPYASHILAQLEMSNDFRDFMMRVPNQGSELRLSDFINRPLRHLQDLCGVARVILDTTSPHSRDHATYTQIVKGLQMCVATIESTEVITSVCPSMCRPISTGKRVVSTRTGSAKLSCESISSGFGSGSSQHSGISSCPVETDSLFDADVELRQYI